MPEDRPDPLAPRPVIPIDDPTDPAIPVQSRIPEIPIAEPGVVTPAPFAQVYNPSDNPPTPPPPPPAPYYPPAYPQQQQQQWPVAPAYVIPSRPGLLTGIGVMCIVVASLSLVASFICGCTAVWSRTISQQSVMSARLGTATTMPMAGVFGADTGPNGLAPHERAVVAQALRTKQRLSAARAQQLDAFLKEHGRSVLQPAGVLTTRTVTGYISSSGQEFADTGNTGPDFFVFTQGQECRSPGRLKIYDDRANYTMNDGSVLRSQYDPTTPPAAKTDVTPSLGLAPSDARAVVNRVKQMSNNKLNAQQAQNLQAALEHPQYVQWLTPSSTTPGLTSQVKSVIVSSDGMVSIHWSNGTQLVFLANGNTGGAVITGNAPKTTPNNPFAPGANVVTVNHTACNLALVAAVASALLAVLLLVTGILVLRQTPASRWMLLLYSLAKIALAALAIVSFSWMISSLKYSEQGYAHFLDLSEGIANMSIVAIVLTSLGVLFPVTLLFVMLTSKTVKDYYKTGMAA